MPQPTVRTRSDISEQYQWNAPSVFASGGEWSAEVNSLTQRIEQYNQYRGKLSDGPATLLAALQFNEEMGKASGKALIYALISQEVETTNPDAARMVGQVMGMMGNLQAAASFIDPELVQIGQEKLNEWLKIEPALQPYAHYLEDLFRKQAHLRSPEVEELLGSLSPAFYNTSNTQSMLTNADFRFPPAKGADGQEIPVTQGTYEEILAGRDREARRTAFESYNGTYLNFKNTLASNLNSSIQQNVFTMRARRYPSTLAMSLDANNIPLDVFHNLVDTFQKNLPTWHRYWQVRRKALGVNELHPYDIWAPISKNPPRISYEQGVEYVCQGLAPLGAEYVETIRRGCLEQRWIDVYPTAGKTSSQFSAGWPGTHPFIVLSYDDTIFSLSTLAHELGHSMHSYLTWQNQPFIYSQYSLFAAEVASNFHQAMVRAHLLNTQSDPDFQIAVIEEAMANFHRYFFIMPTLARFELEMHERAERGQGLAADDLNARMADLFEEGYGGQMHVDREQVGITWATFGHLYQDYYVFQYTTGISGANALSRRILAGDTGAVERYLGFLKTGAAIYPIDALKRAGVDLSTPAPIEETFEVLSGLVDRLEKLTA